MKNVGIFAAGYVLGFATLFVLMLIFGDYEDEPNLAVAQSVAAQQPTASGPAFDAVCDADTNNMTDPQIAAFAKRWEGQPFDGWNGWVYDVVSRSDGTYNLEISMQERGLFWSRNIVVENIPSDLALKLNVEEPIAFAGRVKRNETFLDGVCNPLVIADFVKH